MNSPSKILFVSTAESLSWGGSEVLWVAVARELSCAGHSVFFSYHYWPEKPAPLQALEASGGQGFYRGDPAQEGLWKGLKRRCERKSVQREFPAFTESHWLLSLVMRVRPDLIVFNLCDAYQLIDLQSPIRCLQAQHIPYYIICHLEAEAFLLFPQKRNGLRELYARACGVAFGSQNGAEMIARQLALNLPTVEIFDNPPNIYPQALPWPDNRILRMACVGRLDVGAKGQDYLLSVLGGAIWRERLWQLTLYGMGQDEAYIRQLISHYHLNEKVVLAGYVSSAEEIWKNEQVCLQPSPKEGTPMTVVEALFAGRPCIVSDRARMPQLIQPGKTGWVVPLSMESLARAMDEVWLNRARLRSMGEDAHVFIRGYWRLDYPSRMASLLEKAAGMGAKA